MRRSERPVARGAMLLLAASVIAILCGCVAASDAFRVSLDPLSSPTYLNLGRYAYVLTHLAVGAGLVSSGALSLHGLRKGSDGAVLLGQVVGLVSFGGMLLLEILSLWTLDPLA